MEYFSDRVLAIDQDDPFDMPEGYSKFDYQADAVVEGYQKLIRYDGFFLADVVGLGKTVVATMIAKKFLIENGQARHSSSSATTAKSVPPASTTKSTCKQVLDAPTNPAS